MKCFDLMLGGTEAGCSRLRAEVSFHHASDCRSVDWCSDRGLQCWLHYLTKLWQLLLISLWMTSLRFKRCWELLFVIISLKMSGEERRQIWKRSPSLFSHISEQLLIITICQTLHTPWQRHLSSSRLSNVLLSDSKVVESLHQLCEEVPSRREASPRTESWFGLPKLWRLMKVLPSTEMMLFSLQHFRPPKCPKGGLGELCQWVPAPTQTLCTEWEAAESSGKISGWTVQAWESVLSLITSSELP